MPWMQVEVVTATMWEYGGGGDRELSPRFSALVIGSWTRVCGGTVDTMNIDSRAPMCPLLIWRCERGAY
jgi:hypothetical protein